jgi:uncharacterized protein (DUF362 family)
MSTVYFRKTNNRRDFVIDALKLFEKELASANSFLIKPNIVSYEEYPTTTHPEVLDAALGFLPGRDVVVADGPAPDAGSSRRVLDNSPLRKICDNHNVPFLNLYTTKAKRFATQRRYRLKIFTLPLEKDFVISLPVLKTHNSCMLTGALKNQFGYLTKLPRVLMHVGLKDIHKGIAELNVITKPNLFIIDAVQTLVGAQELRHGGNPKDLGYMLAGTDPVSLDSFGLKLLQKIELQLGGESPEDIPYLKYAFQYGVGTLDFEEKEI